ncbi:MAG TPA: sensor histidine kinase, partial [Cellvibrionaceae bacterium]|nr:sensor histidine kinase [Cellvibrionaceae bacterium]
MTLPTEKVDFSLVLAASVHDMKNSIGMLIGSLEQVIDELPPVNDVQAQHFNTLQYEASRINGELVQLLTIYRMQNDLLPFRQDQHYVLDVLEDQIARNHVLIENR